MLPRTSFPYYISVKAVNSNHKENEIECSWEQLMIWGKHNERLRLINQRLKDRCKSQRFR